jgi:hypothetical protein
MPRYTLNLAVALAVVLPFNSAVAADADRCFRLHEPLNFSDKKVRTRLCASEIPSLMHKRLTIDANYQMRWPRQDAQSTVIDTCERYLREVGFSHYTGSRADLGVELPFLRTCGVLASLAKAKVGKSRFASPTEALQLRVLPPTVVIHSATADQADQLERLEASGKTAYDVISETGDVSHIDIDLTLLAEGDIDGDGCTDYLIERNYRTATDSSVVIGYLGCPSNRNASIWTALDRNNTVWPNRTVERDARKSGARPSP